MFSSTTTNGSAFTRTESIDMARIVFKRFGHDPEAATAAWCRLLQNQASVSDFMALIESETHTAHCEGYCQAEG